MYLLFLALIPIIIVLLYIYFNDKFEKEPLAFLGKNFLLGAFVSVIITLLLGYFANLIYPITNDLSILQQFVKAFFYTRDFNQTPAEF